MSKTKVAAITELVRKVDYHLLKLDLNLKVTDAAQLTTKKPLLTALQQCKELLDQNPKVSSGLPSSPILRRSSGSLNQLADYRRNANSKDSSVIGFRKTSMQVLTEVKERILAIKTAIRKENDPATLDSIDSWTATLAQLEKILTDAIQQYESTTMEVRHYCSISVSVSEAKQLPPTDLSGSIDSYVEVWVDNHKKAKTRTIWKNVNPCWMQDFYFYLPADAQDVIFKVYDEYSGLHDHFIGSISVPIERLKKQDVLQEWFPLVAKGVGGVGAAAAAHFILDYKPGFSSYVGNLNVTVIEAIRLVDDPEYGRPSTYCKVELITKNSEGKVEKEKPQRTNVVKKSDNPKWNETFSFKLIWEQGSTVKLRFTIYETALGIDKFLGSASIPIHDLFERTKPSKVDKWVKVTPKLLKDKNVGSLRLTLKYREEKVLPDSGYDNLLEWLLDEDLPFVALIPKLGLSVPEKKEIFRSLIAVYESKAKSVWFLQKVMEYEIDKTSDLNILFRGNTVATICFDCYLQIAGKELLMLALQQPIRDIYKSDRSCELDPERVEESTGKTFNQKKNLDYLLECLDRIWVNILKYTSDVPITIRAVLSTIRTKVMAKWPNEETTHYTCVTAFIFLRFFCAAILGPQLFGLAEQNPEPLVARNLTIIAKTLMNLGNLVLFGKKEPYLVACNDWLTQNFVKLKQYIDTISSYVDPSELPLHSTLAIDYGQEMSHIHRFLDVKKEAIKKEIEECWAKIESGIGFTPTGSPTNSSKHSPAKSMEEASSLPPMSAASPRPATRPRSASKVQREILRTSLKQFIKDNEEEYSALTLQTEQLTKYAVSLDKLVRILGEVSSHISN